MALLHHKSPEYSMSELDLFAAPGTQLSIEQSQHTEVSPISAITDTGPIEFFIPGDGEKYMDLSNTLLYLRLQITNADGTNLAQDARVGIINYPLHTIRFLSLVPHILTEL